MGVPAFFRWLCARNPQFILDAMENYEEFDMESNNPDVDNLYLDMNGIIHPCCRSDGSVVPIAHSIQDMFNNVFLYIDKLVDLCRPKKILYMAIDGVAPRAKMNQQRARRFKGAKEAVDLQMRKEELLKEFSERSEINDDILSYVQNRFDTNVITPGTAFMRDLSKALQHYVVDRMNSHPLFQNLQVIFSDAGMPGEGEHKILDFIRVQRDQPGYNPNTKHCLYGADADLIMLGLSTHEPYFYIIREQIITQEEKKCSICNELGHFQMDCPNDVKEPGQRDLPQSLQRQSEQKVRKGILQTFQFAKLYVMRQYLEMRFEPLFSNGIKQLKFDIEKICDDFVFMCFFVGNDFLPHIPNLSIRDGGIDALLTLYEHVLTQVDDYLTNNGQLNLKSVAKYIESMSIVEEELMKVRKDKEERDKKFQEINKDKEAKLQQMRPHMTPEEYQKKRKEWRLRDEKKVEIPEKETLLMRFKRVLEEKQHESKTIKEVKESTQVTLNYNYKLSYYNDKFGVKPKDFIQMQSLIKQAYVEALCWNFQYYYRGCVSWGWYYPFHYSPFASDLLDIDQHIIHFDLGEPFKPFYQLLSVFPAASALSVPECFRELMISPQSEISDFYPTDFYVDLIGKRYEWLGEVILPFIEEDRLLRAARKYEHLLSAEEKQRNSVSNILIFYNQNNKTIVGDVLNQETHNISGQFQEQQSRYGLKVPIPLLDPCLNIKRVTYNNVVCKPIAFPEFVKHDIYLLEGLIPPQVEISQKYMQKADLRTYQGEYTIKLIQRILRGQHNTGEWEKVQEERISYNSGHGAYGNALNFREMKKHQDQIEKLSNQGHGPRLEHQRSNERGNSNYNRGGGQRYQQQEGQNYSDPNNIYSALDETQQQQPRYNRQYQEHKNFKQYPNNNAGGGYEYQGGNQYHLNHDGGRGNSNNSRGGYHGNHNNNAGRYNNNRQYDDQQGYQGGRAYSQNRGNNGGQYHQQPYQQYQQGGQRNNYHPKPYEFDERGSQRRGGYHEQQQQQQQYQVPQVPGYSSHRENYDNQYSASSAAVPPVQPELEIQRRERDDEEMEYDPTEAIKQQGQK